MDQDELAYQLWCQGRLLEAVGDREIGERAVAFYGQATGFKRAAWIVLMHGREAIDAQLFEKRDRERLVTPDAAIDTRSEG